MLPDEGCCPLDIDNPDSFDQMQAETVWAPPTPAYLTGGAPDRQRLVFQYDPRLQHANHKLADGVQLRFSRTGSALMSTVPPSVHPITGITLEWIMGLDEVPLAPLPELWLARVLSDRDSKKARPTRHWRELVKSHPDEGDRHGTVVSLAGHLAARGVDAHVATQLLCGWVRWKCKLDGKRIVTDEEVAKAVIYAVKKETEKHD
jgi:hypothetical protein